MEILAKCDPQGTLGSKGLINTLAELFVHI